MTFGTISALFGLSHGIISQAQYSAIVAAVVASAVVPTLIANAFLLPHHLLPKATVVPESTAPWAVPACGRSCICCAPSRAPNSNPRAATIRSKCFIRSSRSLTYIPAGNVWVANNWDLVDQGFKQVPDFDLSTRFGDNGFVVFFGVAKPMHTPLVGPARGR